MNSIASVATASRVHPKPADIDDFIRVEQLGSDGVPTLWIDAADIRSVMATLKANYALLHDLFVIDERLRQHREGQPASDFTVVYHLMSFRLNADVRLKVALLGDSPSLPSICGIWPAAKWYEREAWDMFGVVFRDHPNLRRILLPPTWQGHALRKEHPARATEMEPYSIDQDRLDYEQEALRFVPEDWGMQRKDDDTEFMFLNLGPNHPSVHGVFRIALQLDGEVVVDAVPDIGYHHHNRFQQLLFVNQMFLLHFQEVIYFHINEYLLKSYQLQIEANHVYFVLS